MEAIPVNDKGDDDGKETIHISYLHNSLILKILWKCLRFNHAELNIRGS